MRISYFSCLCTIAVLFVGCNNVKSIWDIDYCYSVRLECVQEDHQLNVDGFNIMDNADPVNDIFIVYTFVGKPYPYVDLSWSIFDCRDITANATKNYSQHVEIKFPPQFTQKNGRGITFLFYAGEVVVTYKYIKEESDNDDNYCFITVLSDGTVYETGDFEWYMASHPGSTAEDFMKYQREYYNNLVLPDGRPYQYGEWGNFIDENPDSTHDDFKKFIEKKYLKRDQLKK